MAKVIEPSCGHGRNILVIVDADSPEWMERGTMLRCQVCGEEGEFVAGEVKLVEVLRDGKWIAR